MDIFPVMLVIGVCVLLSLGTVFSGGIFASLSSEGNLTGTNETATVQAHETISSWTIVIAILLMITAVVMGTKLLRVKQK